PIGNPAIASVENPAPAPENDLISFDKNQPMHQPAQLRKKNVPPVDLLTNDISNIKAGPRIKNNKKIRSNPIPKTDEEWYDLMETDNKDSEPSDSEYNTADEDPDIYFEKRKDPYINRISETEKFNEGEVCDYYAFVPKGYYAENEPLGFFESIEEKIADVYKKELVLKRGLKPTFKSIPFKYSTIEIIREDRINATIKKGYNEIIDEIEDEALQESGWSFVRAEEVFLEISAFRPLRGSSYLALPKALDKPLLGLINPQNNEDNELRRNANIANFEGIKFPATLHDVDKFEENNPNYAINIFPPFYREAFRKIIVDIDLLHISERNYQVAHMIDLLYLTEDFERLLHKWNNHHGKKYFCRKCLRFPYSRLDLLQEHIPKCPGSSKASQYLILPEEAEEIEVEKEDKEGNTIKEAEQKVISYEYTIHCSDGKTQKPVINRESKNIIKDLMYNLQEDLDVILNKLCDPLPCEKLIPKLWRQYQTANKCWICEKKLHESGYNKIRVFDPETKKYLGALHRKCHRKKPMIQGKWKDENAGIRVTGYVGVRAKCYSVITENPQKNMIKAKGLKKSLIKKELTHKIFEDCVLERKEDQPRTAQFL
ncbi:269_t:CDS:2, partial [Acaulospora morrowiae]